MITSTVGADAATETLSVSLPSNDTNGFSSTTAPPTSSLPIATITTMTMTTESAEMECLYEIAATPKSRSGSRGHQSYDRCQVERSSAGTSGLAWWEMITIPPALLLWLVLFCSVYTFAKTVLGYILCRSQPRDSPDPACEAVHGRYVVFGMVVRGEDLPMGVTLSLVSKEKESGTC